MGGQDSRLKIEIHIHTSKPPYLGDSDDDDISYMLTDYTTTQSVSLKLLHLHSYTHLKGLFGNNPRDNRTHCFNKTNGEFISTEDDDDDDVQLQKNKKKDKWIVLFGYFILCCYEK